MQAKGRLQPWNSKSWRPDGLVEAAARDLEGLTAGLNAPTTEGYVQAKGRLQPWNSKSWRPEGLVEAAARELEGFKGFKGLKPGKRQAWKGFRGLCAGKGQAATLEQQRLMARGLCGSCREGFGGL